MSPLQFQQAMPHLGAPSTTAGPGQRYPQPAGRTRPCCATHCRALAQRSSGVKLPGRATGVGGAVAGGAVAGTTARGLAVVATGFGFGLTVVDVDVDVDVDVEVDVVVDDVVLEVDGSGGGSVVSVAGAGAGAEADASTVDQAKAAPAMATTASTAATLRSVCRTDPAKGIPTCRRDPPEP